MLINNSIFSKTSIPLFERLLRVASSSQKVTASNIANVASPGYEARTVDFVQEMNRSFSGGQVAPSSTNPRHIASSRPEQIVRIKDIDSGADSSGINNVDIENEMSDLAKNQMLYEFGAKRLSRTFGMLRMAIRGKAQ